MSKVVSKEGSKMKRTNEAQGRSFIKRVFIWLPEVNAYIGA